MRINPRDNVEVDLNTGHKIALCDIKKGENVIKYGYPIGHATEDIKAGDSVHTHNIKTNLSELLEYTYEPEFEEIERREERFFNGYVRKNGDVGIRNEIWIVNTVGCVNKVAETLAAKTGAKAFPHPFGCSQLGDDQKTTQLILKGMVKNIDNIIGIIYMQIFSKKAFIKHNIYFFLFRIFNGYIFFTSTRF